MTDNYTIREVQIELCPGVILISDVQSLSAVRKLLDDTKKEGLLDKILEKNKEIKTEHDKGASTDDPVSKIELKAGITSGEIATANIIAFKDNVPQLMKPNSFTNPSDAVLFLLFAIETGLGRSKVDYDSFKGLYEDQNIKSGSPLTVMFTNLRNGGYLDKKEYLAGRSLRLTAKGEKKAIEVLKAQLAP